MTDLSYSLFVNEQEAATFEATFINRDKIPANETFWACMRESHDTYRLAESLFDKYGNLRKKFYEREGAKGCGVWGPELDFANILLMKDLRVHPDWRRHGLGANLVEHALRQAGHSVYRSRCFSFVRPGSLEGGAESFGEEVTIAERFWRSMGYRRVGTSEWLAYSDYPDHPSRFIAPADDFKRVQPVSQQSVPGIAKEAFRLLANEEVSDSKALAYLKGSFPHSPAHAAWTSTDPGGDALLHIAARTFKPESAKYILAKAPNLARRRNNQGSTPREALEDAMESVREPFHKTAFKVEGRRFAGFGHKVVACVGVLTGREVMKLPDTIPVSFLSSLDWVANRNNIVHRTLRVKYGCTCGKCVAGFLSPRLQEKLIAGSQEVEESNTNGVGFSDLCGCIRDCIRGMKVPTEANILASHGIVCGGDQMAADGLEEFLVDGKISDVLAEIFNWVRSDSTGQYVGQRPPCRNDLEFEFVQGICVRDLAR